MIDPKDYWTDPKAWAGTVDPEYIKICSPEFFFHFDHFSERIARALEATGIYSSSSILELGCSIGRNLNYLQKSGCTNLHGVDINPKSIVIARAWTDGIEYETMPIQDYLKPDRSFDVIFTQSVLMHIPPEDEWIFERMAQVAQRCILTHEVEVGWGLGPEFKWVRDYQDVFSEFGFEQVAYRDCGAQQLRVMKKEVVFADGPQ